MEFPGIFGICPVCNMNWKYTVPYYYDEDYKKIDEPVQKDFSKCVAIYDRNRDMTVEHYCPECHSRWDRFTNKLIYKGKQNESN